MKNNNCWGGSRRGAGRKPTFRKAFSFYVTDLEYLQLKDFLIKIREYQQTIEGMGAPKN